VELIIKHVFLALFISHLDENRVKFINNVTRRIQESDSFGRKWMWIFGYPQNDEQNVVECRAALVVWFEVVRNPTISNAVMLSGK
jgi:hypothetical protein